MSGEGDPLLELFLSEFAEHAAVLRASAELSRGKLDAATQASRGLKAAALVVGRRGLAGLCEKLGATVGALGQRALPLDAAAVSVLSAALDLLVEMAQTSEFDPPLEKQQRFIGLLESVSAASARGPLPQVTGVSLAPPPRMRAKRSPTVAGDPTLLAIFASEAQTNASALSSGLVELESGSAPAPTLDKLMRAAHSLKGAARVVGLDAVVELAHAMEDRFVAAQQDGQAIASQEIDLLLRGADQLGEVARLPAAELKQKLATSHEQLRALSIDIAELAQAALSPASRPRPPASRPRVLLETPNVAPDASLVLPSAQPLASAKPDGSDQRIVRVAAESINRLMGLAGESLVEARRIQVFGGALQQLKQRHRALNDSLNELDHLLQEGDITRLAARIQEARERAQECREVLVKQVAEFEVYTRRADDLSDRLYREAQKTRMRPFADGLQNIPRAVRDLARSLGKSVRLEISGEATQVDRDVLESLDAPLNHLIRNAIDHGLETAAERQRSGKPEQGSLRVEAHHRAGMLCIRISDDGRGVDAQAVTRRALERGLITEQMAASLTEEETHEFLFLPGFSTAKQLTEISGRGVGLDVVRSSIVAMGGNISITSQLGRGTTFLLQLPVTRSVLRAILVEIAGEAYAFPLLKIERVVRVPVDSADMLEGSQYIGLDGKNVGLVRAEQVLRLEIPEAGSDELCVVVIGEGEHHVGVVVDRFLGEHDLVVRPLDSRLGKVQDLAAAAILADGTPALIVDVDDMLRSIDKLIEAGRLERVRKAGGPAVTYDKKRVLVVDDSITVREVERQLLVNRGYAVDVAVDGMDGWNSLRNGRYDLVVTDLDMPRMSGLELVRAIKADVRLQSTPVVIVSYKDRDEDRLKGLEAGANYYLTKSSFHDDRFVLAVEELIGAPA